ncbi:SIR2-like domain-containing protein [Paraburkholderia susongensis]|uniref:SIR2-like domain-containing protein n=2 Tax=Paraburkholderia susongensis TaxID=1515439 RepID=A0A1X7KG14_9BURK|nr:SIR2-like domain-containing protein [Paraburkholderia susongensis]
MLSAYSFETFVIELLRVHAESQAKPFDSRAKFRTGAPREIFMPDGFAPQGFDDFHGPVIVECYLSLSRQNFSRKLNLLQGVARAALSHAEVRPPVTLLFITDQLVDLDEFEPIVRSSGKDDSAIEVVIWGKAELNQVSGQHPEVSEHIVGNLLSMRVRSVLKNKEPDWRTERGSRVSKLAERFSTGQFSLFLGAGVSSSAGMPDWNSLLNALFVTYLTEDVEAKNDGAAQSILELVKRMNALDGPSALVSARYLRKGIAGNSADGRDFTGAIRKALYGLRKQNWLIDSPLIRVLVELCIPRRSGALVRSVITYNFDDLFERQLQAKSIPHKAVYSQTASVEVDDLPVYHVHGFIPEKASPYDGLDDATLVFAEEGYHQIYTDAYHWSNLVQLSALRDSTCLMVGLSMADPNLRRLLEISNRGVNEPRHFAFMKRMTVDSFVYDEVDNGKKKQILPDLDAAETFLENHHALTEVLMNELGVTVLWYEGYDEIPTILNEVGFPARAK